MKRFAYWWARHLRKAADRWERHPYLFTLLTMAVWGFRVYVTQQRLQKERKLKEIRTIVERMREHVAETPGFEERIARIREEYGPGVARVVERRQRESHPVVGAPIDRAELERRVEEMLAEARRVNGGTN